MASTTTDDNTTKTFEEWTEVDHAARRAQFLTVGTPGNAPPPEPVKIPPILAEHATAHACSDCGAELVPSLILGQLIRWAHTAPSDCLHVESACVEDGEVVTTVWTHAEITAAREQHASSQGNPT